MSEPNPPFLELNFYFANQLERAAFSRLIMANLDLGATFAGLAFVHRGDMVRDEPFSGITDHPLDPISIKDDIQLRRYLADPDVRLIQVYMNSAARTNGETSEIVTLLSCSREAAQIDHHPIAIWTSGSWTSWQNFPNEIRESQRQIAREEGKRAYKRFISLIEILKPSYAAITVEYDLECPIDLSHNPRSYAFRDFFISKTFIGERAFRSIEQVYSGAYLEAVSDGIYVSSTMDLNPIGFVSESEIVLDRSVTVAKAIAAKIKKGLEPNV